MPSSNWMTPSNPHRHDPNLAEEAGCFPGRSTGPPPAIVLPSSGPVDKPQSPAAPLPDIEQSLLQPRPEDFGHSGTTESAAPNQSTTGANGEFMRATMTDVQHASGQLGDKDDYDSDDSRSFTFSFSVSLDESTDHDTDADTDGQERHSDARQKLTDKAKKAVGERVRDAAEVPMPMHSIAPPIDVELSNNSSDEGDGPLGGPSSDGRKEHSHIHEEDTPAPHGHHLGYPSSIQPSGRFIVPYPVSTSPHPEYGINEDTSTGADVATATQPQKELTCTQENNISPPSTVSPPGVRGISNGVSGNDAVSHSSPEGLVFLQNRTLSSQEGAGVIPSSAASLNGHQHNYSNGSVTSSTRVATSSPSPLSTTRSAVIPVNRMPRSVHPVEWTVEEVVDWLRSKGFDDMVCNKFSEQEITGDILFELDMAILKSEIGIIPYGTRIRIARAITDLRRPPSVLSSSAEQHIGSGSLSHGSPLAPQDIPLASAAQGSPNGHLVSPEVPPGSGDLMGPFVPVRLGSVGFGGRLSASATSNGGIQSNADVVKSLSSASAASNGGIHSNGDIGKSLSSASAASNGGINSNGDIGKSLSSTSTTSNGGIQSNADISKSQSSTSAPSSGGVWSFVTKSNGSVPFPVKGMKGRLPLPPALGKNAVKDSGVLSDSATKNVVTKLRSLVFGRPISSSTRKLPSSRPSSNDS